MHPLTACIKRDIVALCDDPPLLSTSFLNDFLRREKDTLLSRLPPKSAHNFLFRRQTVGSYFESLIIYLLMQHKSIQLLDYNAVIKRHNKTITELDLIYLYRNTLYHTELSYKHYLYRPYSATDPLVGPNKKDTLSRRIEAFQHQLDIGYNQSILDRISSSFQYKQSIMHDYLLKGRIFLPVDTQLPASLSIEKESPISHYYTISNLLHNLESTMFYRFIRKLEWISPVVDRTDQYVMQNDELQEQLEQHFTSSEKSILVAKLQQDKEKFYEIERFYVVHDGW